MNLRGGKSPVYKDMDNFIDYTHAKSERYIKLCDRLSMKPVHCETLSALNYTDELEMYKAK